MKKLLIACLSILPLAAAALPQEIFDALCAREVAAVKALVEKSPGVVDSRDGDGLTPLHYAAREGDTELINYLVDKGAKLEFQTAQAKTPLHLAAMNDREAAAAALLKKGAALEARDDYLRTALILCARERGGAGTARLLLDAGADINAADKFGETAIGLAAWRGKREVVDLLLARGAKIPTGGDDWRAAIALAVSHGLTTLFGRLTKGSPDLKAVETDDGSLLHAAAAGSAAEIVGILLDKGLDPAARNRYGWTPLHYAARDGRTQSALKLIERGSPLNARTLMGQTAYNIARERGMEAVAGLLARKGAETSEIRFPVLEGDYLGQKPPESGPELFALGIISSIWGLHSTAVFSPDGNEVYWAPMMTFPGETYSQGGLLMMKRAGGRWSAPDWAPFSGPEINDDVPFFSADGKRIYFISSSPRRGGQQGGGEGIWYADRAANGWSEPQPLDPLVNAHNMHWAFSLDKGGDLYFGGQSPESLGSGDIYLARFAGGKYEKPVNLGGPVNSAGAETTPFISPDGSYLVFSREYDLWVSFRGAGEAWSEPVRLGPEVNSPEIELCPVVTADGKYLFFVSNRGGESHAWWVRADVITRARASVK
jgi:ankyrin repeat protein